MNVHFGGFLWLSTGTLGAASPARSTGKHRHELATWKYEIHTASVRPLVHMRHRNGCIAPLSFCPALSWPLTLSVFCAQLAECAASSGLGSGRMEVPPVMETTLPTRATHRYIIQPTGTVGIPQMLQLCRFTGLVTRTHRLGECWKSTVVWCRLVGRATGSMEKTGPTPQ